MFFSPDVTFSAFVADKSKHDVIGRFGGSFRAYEALARQLVRASVRRGEVIGGYRDSRINIAEYNTLST